MSGLNGCLEKLFILESIVTVLEIIQLILLLISCYDCGSSYMKRPTLAHTYSDPVFRISFLFHLFLSSYFLMFLISVFFGFRWQSCFCKMLSCPKKVDMTTLDLLMLHIRFATHLLFSSVLQNWFAVMKRLKIVFDKSTFPFIQKNSDSKQKVIYNNIMSMLSCLH